MYAILVSGGKQYRVEKDAFVKIDKIDAEVGSKAKFDVAFISDDGKVKCGNPILDGAFVEAEVIAQDKTKKIIVYKYKAKKNERKRQGHRQPYTLIKVLNIKG